MIIVTGATGQLGRKTVERLLDRIPADRIGVSVRTPDKAQDLRERGIRVRRGDFAEPATLAHTFEGAEQVLIVSADSTGEATVAGHRAAISAAVAAGARRVLYTSHMGASPTSPFAPMPDHAATEQALRESGAAHTTLRNGFYATSAVMMLGDAVRTGRLIAPQDGPVSWTAHADLAEAAALVLADEGCFDGPTPALTGADSLDLADIAALASDLAGRTVERVVVPDEEYHAGLVAHGVPTAQADLLLGLFEASRQGEFAAVDPALASLTGRQPTPLRDVLKAAIAAAR
ncbi:NAD(P)H-binding protein [Streptomyces kunmingensis]|uniref:NAD(P)H-binding protein n=1 Tax=Streptomyces kunmingensis TaxID=68225 RepID=A0ABU6CDG2_9ACTN|nr:NAD(P)H-binding protein [Streptomyces kunmingensis]MEB3962494.1 NAD(P)H-binding protein [Streptomyces kunmingensis]